MSFEPELERQRLREFERVVLKTVGFHLYYYSIPSTFLNFFFSEWTYQENKLVFDTAEGIVSEFWEGDFICIEPNGFVSFS